MTPSEFKSWFEGFTEALEKTPSEEQWKRIKARVAEIDGRPVTQQVYVDHYLPWYPTRYYDRWVPMWSSGGAIGVGTPALNSTGAIGAFTTTGTATQQLTFDSHAAMQTLGRAEAQGLN